MDFLMTTCRAGSPLWRRHNLVWWLVPLVCGLLPHACVESSAQRVSAVSSGSTNPTAGSGDFDKNALLASLGQNVVLATYDDFVDRAAELEAATAGYASSLSATDRSAAQQAWRDASALWAQAELMQLGPAGVMGVVAGGADYRDAIYSWTLVNRCRTDQELVEGNYSNASAFASEAVNVRGLDALEYLLFQSGTSNACPAPNVINTDGSWSAIVDEVDQRRADYAATLALLLRQDAEELRDAWTPSAGDFVAELATPGATYNGTQAALNAVSDAMFYLEKQTKDMKLGTPVGLGECDDEICPDALESTYAGFSKEQVRGNIIGFQRLFHGQDDPAGDALGFDDYLRASGAADLADQMAADLVTALAAVDDIEEDSLADALQSDRDSVEALYFAVKAVTDQLKTQFISVLNLELPQAVEGDND